MTDNPLISLVIPCYNYQQYVGTAIRSVLDQTYRNWELFVVDNGSTDNSLAVIQSFSDPRINIIRVRQNQSSIHGWEAGLKHCRGEWHGMLSADDFFLPCKLERQVTVLRERPELTVLAGYLQLVDAEGNLYPEDHVMFQHFISEYNQEFDIDHWENWLWRHRIMMPAALYRTDWIRRLGLVRDMQTAGDWDLHLRLLRHGAKFAVVPEPLVAYRWHGANQSDPLKTGQETILVDMVYAYATQYVPWLEQTGRSEGIERGLPRLLEIILNLTAAPQESARLIAAVLHPDEIVKRCSNFTDFKNLDTEDLHSLRGVRSMAELLEKAWETQRELEKLRDFKEKSGNQVKTLKAATDKAKQELAAASVRVKEATRLLNYHRANPLRALKLWWRR